MQSVEKKGTAAVCFKQPIVFLRACYWVTENFSENVVEHQTYPFL